MLFVLQFGIALGNIAYYTLGLSYLDDNVLEHHSPAVIGKYIFEVQPCNLIKNSV